MIAFGQERSNLDESQDTINSSLLNSQSIAWNKWLTDQVQPPCTRNTQRTFMGYQILELLGQGGMGIVHKARQVALDRVCALKTLRGGQNASGEEIARFKMEAEVIARLQHANIVQIYEIGEQDNLHYIALEYIEGSTLQRIIDDRSDSKNWGSIGGWHQWVTSSTSLMKQVCEGIHAVHELGIVHRDLKPANILVTKSFVPKITDFGLAKCLCERDGARTRSGAILGTPSYMPPEQASGGAREVGVSADVYSLGAILYILLTGRPPFRGETIWQTLQQVKTLEPLPPSRIVPKLARDLQTICLKALQKDPQMRYATAEDMAADLSRYLKGEPIRARLTPSWERLLKWIKRRPHLVIFIVALAIAFGAGWTFHELLRQLPDN